ncbi:hypothetical protein F5Y14DRAFT_71361 [Nemania sp. NC0429]|nr:hypothetical protein F5Y14DRAFT_71361 [Nemania sp. NC0429]
MHVANASCSRLLLLVTGLRLSDKNNTCSIVQLRCLDWGCDSSVPMRCMRCMRLCHAFTTSSPTLLQLCWSKCAMARTKTPPKTEILDLLPKLFRYLPLLVPDGNKDGTYMVSWRCLVGARNVGMYPGILSTLFILHQTSDVTDPLSSFQYSS